MQLRREAAAVLSLDQLRAIGRIGQGSVGNTLLVVDDSGEQFALSKVPARANDPQIEHYERIGLPLQATLHAVCPRIIRVHEWEQIEGILYIKSEYVEGTDLCDVLRQERISEKWAIDIAMQALEILEKCHRQTGACHGDLRTQNIRLELGQRVRMSGFGLTLEDAPAVCHPYLSPERLEGAAVDVASDLWSLGVILYKMVAGALPFFDESPQHLHHMIRKCRVPILRRNSPALTRAIYTALNSDPSSRYESAALFYEALENVRSELAQKDRRPARSTREAQAPASPQSTQPPPPRQPEEMPRRNHRRPPLPEKTHREEATVIGFRSPPPEERPLEPIPEMAADGSSRQTAEPSSSYLDGRPVGDSRIVADATLSSVETLPVQVGVSTRTDAPRTASVLGRRQHTTTSVQSTSAPRLRLHLVRIVVGILALLFIGAIAGQISSWTRIAPLQKHLNNSGVEDIDNSWSQYSQLRRFMIVPVGPGLGQVEEELRFRLLTSGQSVLDSYHEDIPTTRESNWREAATHLKNLVTLSPNDSLARAMWYCSQGHVLRIEALSLDRDQAPAEAMIRRSEAVERFERATDLDPEFADPYLGLARIYAYDRFNLEGLEDALHKAEQCGYNIGRRERAQLADAYYSEAKAIYADARKSTDPLRRRDDRESAMTMAHRATQLYGQIPGFAEADRNRSATIQLVQQIKRMSIEP